MELPNIVYKGDIGKTIGSESDFYDTISMMKTYDDFLNEIEYSKFVKACESMVRTHPDYKVFINYIKNKLGIDFCQVFSNITDKIDATVEFHHGPIFTLYDICEIELSKYLKEGYQVNTFDIANSVLDLHFALKVNGVMLSKTVHEMVHNNDVFINVSQNIGDVNAYIEEYHQYFNPEVKYKIYNYLKMCESNSSFDRGSLDLDHIKKYIELK